MALTVPYVTVSEIIEYPTFLDLLDLRSGDPLESHQYAILNKMLMLSSAWCDSYVEMGTPDGTLSAHTHTDNKRMRPDRYGRLLFTPTHTPFVSLQSLSYGSAIGTQTVFPTPSVFVEDNRSVIVDLQSGTTAWSGSLQFGIPTQGAPLFTSWTYIAGFPNTLLASNVSVGATSLPVLDVIGIQPGQSLKIFDPDLDETITISNSWVPTTGPASLPLRSPLLNAHVTTDPVRVSAMGHDIFEACIYYAIAMLIRPDTAAEDTFPDLRGGTSTRLADSRKDGSGLIGEAMELLEPYRRIF